MMQIEEKVKVRLKRKHIAEVHAEKKGLPTMRDRIMEVLDAILPSISTTGYKGQACAVLQLKARKKEEKPSNLTI